MSESLLLIPETCLTALQAIETDPLELPEDVMLHLRTCLPCREARVQWLAQEDAPHALAPAGYFQHLPHRVLSKIPIRPLSTRRSHPFLWLAAGFLAATASVGGFLAGRANRAPMVEASMPVQSSQSSDTREVVPVAPFHTEDDVLSQISTLSPEETEALAKRLDVEAKKP